MICNNYTVPQRQKRSIVKLLSRKIVEGTILFSEDDFTAKIRKCSSHEISAVLMASNSNIFHKECFKYFMIEEEMYSPAPN